MVEPAHIAANSDATTVCLDVGRRSLGRFRLWRFHRGEEIDNNDPKSGCQRDEPASEPP